MFQHVGKWLLIFAACLAAVGGVLWLLGRAGVGRLPGDLSFGGKNWRVFLPLGTCIGLSALLTLVLWIVSRLRR